MSRGRTRLSRRAFCVAAAAWGPGLSLGTLFASQNTSRAKPRGDGVGGLLADFVTLHSRPDGRPVFWRLTGTEYAVSRRRAIPYALREVVTAQRAIMRDGRLVSTPYVEMIRALSAPKPSGTFSELSITPPFGGRYQFDGTPDFNRSVETSNGTSAVYQGTVARSAWDEQVITQNYDILIDYPNGQSAVLNELITLSPAVPADGTGFRTALASATIVRPHVPGGIWGDEKAISVSTYSGEKYASEEGLKGSMSASELEGFEPFFGQWRELLDLG